MKYIYIVVTDTGTILSKIVKNFMKDEYGHVSISLDKDLNEMYSFGRLNPYNAFYGGFVHEHIHSGTFKRFKNTKAKIIELDVKDNQYEKLKQQIEYFEEHKGEFKFNTRGLFAIYINKKVKRKNYFYCAEFVKYILEKSGIDLNLQDLIRPENFKKINGGKEIYNGLLKKYN